MERFNNRTIWQLIESAAKRTLQRAEVDRATLYSILQSLAVVGIGPVIALLITARFNSNLQGYYYTFGSLSALQVLADLGLGQAIIQFASHEWSKLRFSEDQEIVGDKDALSRLISLAQISLKWYGFAALICVGAMVVAGNSFFTNAEHHRVEWLGPWIAFCVAVGLNMVLTPIFYLLQGCNQVAEFWFYRFVLQVLNGLALGLAIVSGAELWSLSIAGFTCIIWSAFFLWTRHPNMIRLITSKTSGLRVSWRTEVWPMQWRVAVSWLSTYFTSQMFVPILFRFADPSVAGQAGLTITVSNALLSLANSWMITKAPRFGMLIAQRNFKELDFVFFRALFISSIVAIFSGLTVWIAIYILNAVNVPIAERLLSPLSAALLLLTCVVTVQVTALATYLRSHKKEPLVAVLLLTSLATTILALLTVGPFGAEGVFASYLAMVLCFEFPLCIVIFKYSRAKWHSEALMTSQAST